MAPPKRLRIEGGLYTPRIPVGAVYVGRAVPTANLPASKFANHYLVAAVGRNNSVRLFCRDLALQPTVLAAVRTELTGLDLACWCSLDEHCHADVLLQIANGGSLPSGPVAPPGLGQMGLWV